MANNSRPDIVTIDLKTYAGPLSNIVVSIIIGTSLIISSALLAGGVGFGTGSTNVRDTATTSSATTTSTAAGPTLDTIRSLASAEGSIVLGNVDSPLLFTEVSDPSCPYCHLAGGLNPELNLQVGTQFLMPSQGGTYIAPVEEIKRLVNEGRAAFYWTYANGHGNGELGAQAIYCGYENGKFWEVHDLLMSSAGYSILNDTVKNDVANAGTLADFLASAIDKQTMLTCLSSGKYKDRIAQDQQNATNVLTITGTPNFFVNETRYGGAYSFTDMEAVVNQYL